MNKQNTLISGLIFYAYDAKGASHPRKEFVVTPTPTPFPSERCRRISALAAAWACCPPAAVSYAASALPASYLPPLPSASQFALFLS